MTPGEPGMDSHTPFWSGQLGGEKRRQLLRPQSPAADRETAYFTEDTKKGRDVLLGIYYLLF